MFHPSVSTRKQCSRRHPTLSRAMAVVVSGALAIVSDLERAAFAFGVDPPQSKAESAEPRKNPGVRDVEAARKLLADLETAIGARADHCDYSRLDRELAAAFRGYGVDLNVLDPKAAGARLAGRAVTPEVAAAIDEWCRVRRTRLSVPTWRRLAEVARAADPDPWRNAVRDRYGRPPADALPALRARAADAQALEKQPVRSLLLLSHMLLDADDRPTAAAVARVARRRFPSDFWVCVIQGDLCIDGSPKPAPAEAAQSYTAAVALRLQSPLAHAYLAVALHHEKKLDEANRELREATRLAPDTAMAQFALGSALLQTGRRDEAVARFRESVRLEPGNAQAHSYLAAHYCGRESTTGPSPRSARRSASRPATRMTSLA